MRELHQVHRPGWEHETRTGRTYMVWAPRADRPHWTASWQNAESTDGDFRRGDSLDGVLSIFPPAMRPLFRHMAGTS